MVLIRCVIREHSLTFLCEISKNTNLTRWSDHRFWPPSFTGRQTAGTALFLTNKDHSPQVLTGLRDLGAGRPLSSGATHTRTEQSFSPRSGRTE